MNSSILADHLRPGDTVVIGQATSEPRGLVRDLFDIARTLDSVNAFCGFSLNPEWKEAASTKLRVSSYCGQGMIRHLATQGTLRLVPCHLSQLPSYFRSGLLPSDLVLLQVSPADAAGYHSLGCSLDYVWDAAQIARTVLVEINPNVPRTRSPYKLHRSQVVEVRQTGMPLPELRDPAPGQAQLRIGQQVAQLVPDGASIQLGIGGISSAVAMSLHHHRGLKIRSGMVGDWFLDLVESGAVDTSQPAACLTSIAVGGRKLYEAAADTGFLEFVTSSQLIDAAGGATEVPFIAINSAVEVDLAGQVNAEIAGTRYVGAVGGQVDYFRAARRTAGGLAIVALPATTDGGELSRIVERSGSGCVTSAQSDIDFIITENGCADIRATSLTERRKLIAGIADEKFSAELR